MVLRRWRPPVVLEGNEHKEMCEGERPAMGKPRGTVRYRGEEGAHRKTSSTAAEVAARRASVRAAWWRGVDGLSVGT